MRRALLLITVNIVLVLFQMSFFGELFDPIFVPNLIFAFAFALLFNDLSESSYMSAFIGGLVFDLLTFGIIGMTSLTFVGFLFLFSFVRRYVSKNTVTGGIGVILLQFIYTWFILGFRMVGIPKLLLSGFVTLVTVYLFQFILRGFVDYLRRSGFKILE